MLSYRNRREILRLATGLLPCAAAQGAIPDKLVVLTFDDAAKTHRAFVAPYLKQLGFGVTFFISHRWMDDRANFMSWEEIAEIHKMGFEIGNHSWTHANFATPRRASYLAGELSLVEKELARVGVPRPVSFAYPANDFGPEALKVLRDSGYRLARRGMQPETPFGEMRSGPMFDPAIQDRLLIPTTGDADPSWTFEYFKPVVDQAKNGKAVVLQFHGVPDTAHPWVLTPRDKFRQYMDYLKTNGFRVVALRDLDPYFGPPAQDPNLTKRYPPNSNESPVEVAATRADLAYWLEDMLRYHRFSLAEAAGVCGLTEEETRRKATELGLLPIQPPPAELRVLPYPGGRSPRTGFLEGSINPKRGTKASVFLPWDPASYVVLDVPESIVCSLGRIFLAHYHVPTIWDDQNLVLDNIDWTRGPANSLSFQRTLPNFVTFGASVRPVTRHVEMEVWIRNFSGQDITGQEAASARAQVCIQLSRAAGFNAQTTGNKIFDNPAVAVRSESGDRWILTAWDKFGRSWGNERCPCMHSDPIFPDCAFGETVRARGRLWFYQGKDIGQELKRAKTLFQG